MKKAEHLIVFLLLLSNFSLVNAKNLPTKTEVVSVIQKANNYWQDRNPNHGNSFWNRAAYHTGNMAAYQATKNKRYYDYSYAWSDLNQWKGARSDSKENWKYSYGESNDYVLFGDYQICFQVYIDLYHIDPEEHKIARALEVMEYQMSTSNNDYWWWADGLYMVMPVMTRLYKITENPLYLEKLFEYFSYADSIMYDTDEGLYFRDARYVYPKHETINGLKDFWARGSGWVFAGFARILEDLPENDQHRPFYLQRYRAMAAALKVAQQPEGYWTRSLLDPAHAPGPETSGTAFFTYGYLWGINKGILSVEEYGPTVEKAWDYLTNVALQSDGRVGFVQPIGENANPYQSVSATSTADFGVGAFLLAASEMLHMATGEMPERMINLSDVQIENPNQMKLVFSEVLDPASATDPTNYYLNTKAVNGTISFDGTYTVTIKLYEPIPFGPYTVEVFNLTGTDGEVLEANSRRSAYYNVPLTDIDTTITVTAVGNQFGNPPNHTIDNSLNTRWSQPGIGQWIKFDLGNTFNVWAVDIAFYLGDQRNSYFDIEVSTDDELFTTVLTGGVSSGISTGLERYTFTPTQARYVRIICNGNSEGGQNWNSLTQVRIRHDEITNLADATVQTDVLQVVPNPARTDLLSFFFRKNTTTDVKVSIFDISGRKLHERISSSDGERYLINDLNLEPGVYVLNIETAGESRRISFMVKAN